jgi:NADP-dependent 3-hydroxy acid dehydrogenase YdfG
MKLKGLCSIITGASRGLGFEIAKQFVMEGAHVMLCARHIEALLEAQQKLITLSNGQSKISVKTTDISKIDQVEALVATTLTEFQKIDILVANAGVYGTKGPIDEIDWDEWSNAIDINLKGTVIPCRTVIPHFKKNKSGKIIILSGGGATKPMPYMSA